MPIHWTRDIYSHLQGSRPGSWTRLQTWHSCILDKVCINTKGCMGRQGSLVCWDNLESFTHHGKWENCLNVLENNLLSWKIFFVQSYLSFVSANHTHPPAPPPNKDRESLRDLVWPEEECGWQGTPSLSHCAVMNPVIEAALVDWQSSSEVEGQSSWGGIFGGQGIPVCTLS